MVVSAVLAVWVTMTMVYAAVVMREVVDDSTGRWKDGIRVLAFLTDDLSFDEIEIAAGRGPGLGPGRSRSPSAASRVPSTSSVSCSQISLR